MNNAPQSSKLDDLLKGLGENPALGSVDHNEVIAEARTEFLALIEEVIGEDEPEEHVAENSNRKPGGPIDYPYHDEVAENRNELRAEQRLRKDAL